MPSIFASKQSLLVRNDPKTTNTFAWEEKNNGFMTLFAVEMGKTKIKMKKLVYLGLVVFELSKTLMHKFHYDYMPPK